MFKSADGSSERTSASAAECMRGEDLAVQMMSVNLAATITTGWTGGGVNINRLAFLSHIPHYFALPVFLSVSHFLM